jgi:hypothetical protein
MFSIKENIMSPTPGTQQASDQGFRWWWILPGLAALLAGCSYWLWMRRNQIHIQPVHIDLSFIRSQPFQPNSAPAPASAEILIMSSEGPGPARNQDVPGQIPSNGSGSKN